MREHRRPALAGRGLAAGAQPGARAAHCMGWRLRSRHVEGAARRSALDCARAGRMGVDQGQPALFLLQGSHEGDQQAVLNNVGAIASMEGMAIIHRKSKSRRYAFIRMAGRGSRARRWRQPIRCPYRYGRNPSKHSAQGLKPALAIDTRAETQASGAHPNVQSSRSGMRLSVRIDRILRGRRGIRL